LGTNGFYGGAIYSLYYLPNGFSIDSSTFENISIRYDGGAIFDSYNSSHGISNTTFKYCSSSYQRGGAIFLNGSIVPSIINCKFLENTAAMGGNDIYNYIAVLTDYNVGTLSGTCSDSESPRILYSNSSNADHLFMGFFFFFFWLIFIYFYLYLF
jgi:hypothetical protein